MYYAHYAEVEIEWMQDNLAHQEKRHREKKINKVKKAKMSVGFLYNFQKEWLWVCIMKLLVSTVFLIDIYIVKFRNSSGSNEGTCKVLVNDFWIYNTTVFTFYLVTLNLVQISLLIGYVYWFKQHICKQTLVIDDDEIENKDLEEIS